MLKSHRVGHDNVPCLYAEGLQRRTLVPATFGRHLLHVATGAGIVAFNHKLYISVAQLGKPDRARQLYHLLRACRYTDIDYIAGVDRVRSPDTDETTGWKIREGKPGV